MESIRMAEDGLLRLQDFLIGVYCLDLRLSQEDQRNIKELTEMWKCHEQDIVLP